MTHTPPIPLANQSPYPLQEPPRPQDAAGANTQHTDEPPSAVATAIDAAGPLAEKAAAFARRRPYATAALIGTIGLALFNTLRGKRA